MMMKKRWRREEEGGGVRYKDILTYTIEYEGF